jgi:NhaA family Na+:H+ antiporter
MNDDQSARLSPPRAPPGAWPKARDAAQRLVAPVERFLHVEAASGILLLVATAIALALANSAGRGLYEHVLHTAIRVGVGPYTLDEPLHFWINDGLMVVFFFVVGLEVRREIHQGELADLRRASLPLAAALGGMLVPAAMYYALNRGTAFQSGWGLPMATDIAFGVGVLALMGKRIPASVRILLLALAVIDDIGAILVIAVFYAAGFSWWGLAIAAAGVMLVVLMRGFGIRASLAYVVPALIMWAGFLRAGIHPTIAGVILGLMTPVRAWYGRREFVSVASAAVKRFATRSEGAHQHQDLVAPLEELGDARREALSPAVRLETSLHPWVSFGILPLFAFANAGVNLDGIDLTAPGASRVFSGVALGLLFGKPLGVSLACFIAVRAGMSSLPNGLGWKGVVLVGVVAGIGFTMAIFIAGLAMTDQMLAVAKLAILGASVVAGVSAFVLGRLVYRSPVDEHAPTCAEAEGSTEY